MYVPEAYADVMGEPAAKRQGRVDERQELRAAAQLSGETLPGFVLSGATQRAEEVLERAHRLDVDLEAFERFAAALDEPAEKMSKLRDYAHRQSPIKPT